MGRRFEFVNPNDYVVTVTGPDGRQLAVARRGRAILDEWFLRYCPRHLRLVKESDARPTLVQQPTPIPKAYVRPPAATPPPRQIGILADKRAYAVVQRQPPPVVQQRRFVGRTSRHSAAATEHCAATFARLNKFVPSFSNNVGVGILSFNRLSSLQRLLTSIRQHTDMARTLVFISDESTDVAVKNWLHQQTDVVLVDNAQRLGVAGNANRLLRCLRRFRYKLLLNDDVEVLAPGWDVFYAKAMQQTGLHHFCHRQPGLCGAKEAEGTAQTLGGLTVQTIQQKPQGAVLAFDDVAFDRVGFLDETFGLYGMEHVDWSHRVWLSGLQLPGYHDVAGSTTYFKAHNEASAVENRTTNLSQARSTYESLASNPSRIHVDTKDETKVPKISFVIPFRGEERLAAVQAVVANVRAQLFPEVEIIVVEQDAVTRVKRGDLSPALILYCPNAAGVDFCKAKAFNLGVQKSTSDLLVLHDADMLAQMNYAQLAFEKLQAYEGFHMGKDVVYFEGETTEKIQREQRMDGVKCEKTVDYYEGGSLGCLRSKYVEIGGFCELFVGYGVEDCEFFQRLKALSKFSDERTITLFHLQHGRVGNWTQRHRENKQTLAVLQTQPMTVRLENLRRELAKWK